MDFKNHTLIIDGDAPIYRAASIRKRYILDDIDGSKNINKDGNGEECYMFDTFEEAKKTVSSYIDNLKGAIGTDKAILVFGDPEKNFRQKLATITPYKGNRSSTSANFNALVNPRPIYLNRLKGWMQEKYDSRVYTNQEADDGVGILGLSIEKSIMCHIDKDIDMIPGTHCHFFTGMVYEITELESWRNFFKQVLMGDDADNIPGLKGVGPKKSENILRYCDTKEDMYTNSIREYGARLSPLMTPDKIFSRFIEVGNLLWIRRVENDCFYDYLDLFNVGES